MKKRIISLMLAVMLALGLAPAAVAAGFSDVSDSELAAKVELLSELGIINGYADGTFRPNQPLTRAEFTKLVVTMLGRQDDAALYAGYTIFTDVPSGHWAVGFINFAARTPDKGGLGLIKGYTDGSFRPDATINYGEAVTIVLRALGFTDADVGYNWPADYLAKARASGLGEGVGLDAGAAVGRADGARIFYNALFVEAADGSRFIDGVYGETIEAALIIGVDADGIAVYGAEEKFENNAGLTADAVGKRYDLTLWNDGVRVMLAEPVTQRTDTVERAKITEVFTEDGATYVSYDSEVDVLSLAEIGEEFEEREAELTLDRLSGVILAAKLLEQESKTTKKELEFAYYSGDDVTAISGEVVKVPAATVTYATEEGVKGEATTFGALRDHLSYGDRLTLEYDEDGKLMHVIAFDGETTVAVYEPGSTRSELFTALGAPETVKIYKNGAETVFSALSEYDVLSYSEGGAINVSDFKLNAAYSYAVPNRAAATAVTVYGESIELAPCAQDDIAEREPLERILLLFAADGRIAGALEGTNDLSAGVYTGASVQFVGGPEVKMSLAGVGAGELVSVGATAQGEPTAYALRERAASDDLDLAAMTLGDTPLAVGCALYERAGEGVTPVRVEAEDVVTKRIAAEDILHVGYDSAGRANVIILGDVTGDSYEYGRLARYVRERQNVGSILTTTYFVDELSVTNSGGTVKADARQTLRVPAELAASEEGRERYTWGAILVGNVDGAGQVVAAKLLEKSYEIGRANFRGSTAVEIEGERVAIADEVQVYLESVGVFMQVSTYDGDALQMVSAARAQSDSFEVLVSEGKVRVIIVK